MWNLLWIYLGLMVFQGLNSCPAIIKEQKEKLNGKKLALDILSIIFFPVQPIKEFVTLGFWLKERKEKEGK